MSRKHMFTKHVWLFLWRIHEIWTITYEFVLLEYFFCFSDYKKYNTFINIVRILYTQSHAQTYHIFIERNYFLSYIVN